MSSQYQELPQIYIEKNQLIETQEVENPIIEEEENQITEKEENFTTTTDEENFLIKRSLSKVGLRKKFSAHEFYKSYDHLNFKEKEINETITTSRNVSREENDILEGKFSSVLFFHTFVLFIMLLIRIGSTFSRPKEMSRLIFKTSNSTGILESDVESIFTLNYYLSNSTALIIGAFYSFFMVLFKGGLHKFLHFQKGKKYLNVFGLSLNYIFFLIFSIAICVGQTMTMMGILYPTSPTTNYYLIYFGRIIFGFSDGIQECIHFDSKTCLVLTLGFIVSQFEYRNFANAIAFYNVCSLFGRILSVSFANESLNFHLLMSTICCLTGVFFVICFGSILVIFY
jgi:hypothetical protein